MNRAYNSNSNNNNSRYVNAQELLKPYGKGFARKIKAMFERYARHADRAVALVKKEASRRNGLQHTVKDVERFRDELKLQQLMWLDGMARGVSLNELRTLPRYKGPLRPLGPRTTNAELLAERNRRRVEGTDMFGHPLAPIFRQKKQLKYRSAWAKHATPKSIWFMNNAAQQTMNSRTNASRAAPARPITANHLRAALSPLVRTKKPAMLNGMRRWWQRRGSSMIAR